MDTARSAGSVAAALLAVPALLGAGVLRARPRGGRGARSARAIDRDAQRGPMYWRDASRTGYDPDDTALSAASVGRLVPRWQAEIGMGDYLLPAPPRWRGRARRQQPDGRRQLLRIRRGHGPGLQVRRRRPSRPVRLRRIWGPRPRSPAPWWSRAAAMPRTTGLTPPRARSSASCDGRGAGRPGARRLSPTGRVYVGMSSRGDVPCGARCGAWTRQRRPARERVPRAGGARGGGRPELRCL
jgi:hypothetical protein